MKFFSRSTERSKHDCFENKDLTVYQNLGICLSIKKKAKKKKKEILEVLEIFAWKNLLVFSVADSIWATHL